MFIIDDEQRRADPQPPRAQRVAAARAHLRHRRFATMAPHRIGAVVPNLNPRRSQCGRLDFYHGLLEVAKCNSHHSKSRGQSGTLLIKL